MKERDYMAAPGKECVAPSSQAAFRHLQAKGIDPEELPVPGVAVRPGDEEDTGFFVWNARSIRGIHVLPFFNYKELTQRYERMVFRAMEPGEMFLYDNRLYMVKYDRRRGFYLRNVFFYHHEFYAKCEAAIRGYVGAEFMLCRIYVIGRVKKLLGICWIGYVEETGDTIFVKLFQDDLSKFAEYDPRDLAREAVDLGEIFSYQGRCWKLCQDDKGFYQVNPVTAPKLTLVRPVTAE